MKIIIRKARDHRGEGFQLESPMVSHLIPRVGDSIIGPDHDYYVVRYVSWAPWGDGDSDPYVMIILGREAGFMGAPRGATTVASRIYPLMFGVWHAENQTWISFHTHYDEALDVVTSHGPHLQVHKVSVLAAPTEGGDDANA